MKTIKELMAELDKIEFKLSHTKQAIVAADNARQTLNAAFWQLNNYNALAAEQQAVTAVGKQLEAKAKELSDKAIELERQADKIREEIVAKER